MDRASRRRSDADPETTREIFASARWNKSDRSNGGTRRDLALVRVDVLGSGERVPLRAPRIRGPSIGVVVRLPL